MAMGWLNIIIKEKLFDEPFVRNWTNAPFLVRTDGMKLLRESDVKEGGKFEDFLRLGPEIERARSSMTQKK